MPQRASLHTVLMSTSALSGHETEDLDLKIGQLELLETTKSSISLSAAVNLTNPTNYTAFVPFADVNISWNRTLMGHATVKGVKLQPGRNKNIPIHAVWNPSLGGGEVGLQMSRELISCYVSGKRTPTPRKLGLTVQATIRRLR